MTLPPNADPYGQTAYQVRFDWGRAGAEAIVPGAGVVVLVDAFSAVPDVGSGVPRVLDDLPNVDEPDASGSVGEARSDVPIVAASLRNRSAVASWILDLQARQGSRVMVAIVGAGEARDGGMRFAVEDLLAAGAVVDALAAIGIDYCSPEAAVASAAFTGLTRATGHLLTACGGGQELIQAGRRDEVEAAGEVDASTEVQVLGELGPGA